MSWDKCGSRTNLRTQSIHASTSGSSTSPFQLADLKTILNHTQPTTNHQQTKTKSHPKEMHTSRSTPEVGLESTAEISTLRDSKQRATDIGNIVLHSPSLSLVEGGGSLTSRRQIIHREDWGALFVQKSRGYAIQSNGPQLSKCVRLRLVRVSFIKSFKDCDG